MSYKKRVERIEVRAGQVMPLSKSGPFTLPEPDEDYVIAEFIERGIVDGLDYQRTQVLPYQQKNGFSTAETEAKITEFEGLRAQVDQWLEMGEITPEIHILILTSRFKRTPEQRDLIKQRYTVARYIPRCFGTARDHIPVYYLEDATAPDGTIWLRLEGEQWIRDDADPFRKGNTP